MSGSLDLTTVDAMAQAGLPREQGARRAAAGELVRVRRGVYARESDWTRATAVTRHLAAMDAAAHALDPQPVFSHESAAIALGIPIVGPIPARPHVIVRVGGAKTSSAVIRTQRAAPTAACVVAGRFVATSPIVTAIDLAATRTPLSAVIAISHVRSVGSVHLEQLEASVASRRPFRGARRVAAALAASTAGSESPLETLVLIRIRDLGFAEPEQQRVIVVDGQHYRVDFAWEDGQIVLEADGRSKYEGASAAEATNALVREKEREDAIRTRAARFVRTSWREAWDARVLEQRLLFAAVPRPNRPRTLTR